MAFTSTPEKTPADMRIAVLGAGKMGGILLQGFLRSGLFTAEQVVATVAPRDADAARAEAASKKLGVPVTTDNLAAATGADVILLGVKPYQIVDVVREIAPGLKPGALLISVAASIKTSAIEAAAGGSFAVVRAMPNTPSLVGEGMTGLCRGAHVSEEQLALAERIFATVGRTVVVAEKLIDAVTGVSGSGPAFVYIIIEALAEGGVSVGLPRDVATLLAAQTVYGAAKMVLETGTHPSQLKDQVTTPAGTTIEGIHALEEGGLRVTLINAVKRTTARAKELG